MTSPDPRIRRSTTLRHSTLRRTTSEERRQLTLESIRELEAMYERGDIETHAYFVKKRAFIKLL